MPSRAKCGGTHPPSRTIETETDGQVFQASLGYLRLSQNKQKQTRINKQTKEGRKVLLFVNMKVKFTSKTPGRARS